MATFAQFEKTMRRYRTEVDARLGKLLTKQKPASMYDACRYVLHARGKRVRPLLTIFSCESVGGTWRRALPAALAVEILHNFTLVHDDIMDASDSRRGRTTVHKKWDNNVAILVGDALVAVAYHSLIETKSDRIAEISKLFTDGLLDVCEGQTYDMEFERNDDVTVDDYLLMIEKKTGALLKMSVAIGGVVGNATGGQLHALKRIGTYLGLAFQINDDLLDIRADKEKLGKPMYNDIKAGKRTFLLLYAHERATGPQQSVLDKVMRREAIAECDIEEVVRLYHEIGAVDAAQHAIARYTSEANRTLNRLPDTPGRERLRYYSQLLLSRDY
jgi:geranylgeranyl diphosphate synthase, type II